MPAKGVDLIMSGNSNSKNTLSSNREMILTIVSGGIAIALSFVLAQLRLFRMPMGGSVTPASCLPIIIFAMAFGPGWGFAVSIVFSLLQLIGGYLESPFQVLFDYILGYAALGITGFAASPKDVRIKLSNPLRRFTSAGLVKAVIFTVIAYLIRWLSNVIAGVIFWSDSTGLDVWTYSMSYNGAYLAVDMGVLLAVMIILYGVLKKTSK